MQAKHGLTSNMDAQNTTLRNETATRRSEAVEENVAPSVAKLQRYTVDADGNLANDVDRVGIQPRIMLDGHAYMLVSDHYAHLNTLSGGLNAGNEVPRVQACQPAQARYKFDATGHMHLLDGRPLMGTSTVCSEGLPKPGLTWWAAELAAVECLEWASAQVHLADVEEPLRDLLKIRIEYEAVCKLTGKDKKNARDRLQRKYPVFKKARYAHREAKESKAAPGTDMHQALETYVKLCIDLNAGNPFGIGAQAVVVMENGEDEITRYEPLSPEVRRFAEWALDNVQEFLWSEAHCYSERLWTGGICDCGAILKDGTFAVIDFKSSSDAYFSQFVQAGGYSLQIQEQGLFTATGTTVSSGIKHTPAKALVIWPFGGTGGPVIERDVPFWQEQFQAAVTTYKGLQKYEKGKY